MNDTNRSASLQPETILRVQSLLAGRFGEDVETDCGAATLSISPNQLSLTDDRNRVVSVSAEGVLAGLGVPVEDDGDQINLTIDQLATKLVRWYAEMAARDPVDVINGCIAGEIGHIREEQERGFMDDSMDHLNESIVDAIHRRRIREGKANAQKKVFTNGAAARLRG